MAGNKIISTKYATVIDRLTTVATAKTKVKWVFPVNREHFHVN
jgi:hypothetical protein